MAHSRIHHVRVCDGRFLGDVVDTELIRRVEQQLHDHFGPIRPVTKQAKIAKRLLRTPELPFLLAQLVRKLDEQLAVAVPLVLGKR